MQIIDSTKDDVDDICSLEKKGDRCLRRFNWEKWSEMRPVGGLDVDGHNINPLKTKRRLLYLKTQFVPYGKHF